MYRFTVMPTYYQGINISSGEYISAPLYTPTCLWVGPYRKHNVLFAESPMPFLFQWTKIIFVSLDYVTFVKTTAINF